MIRRIVLALALVLTPVSFAGATPMSNQTVRCADLVSAVGTSFTWASGAQTCANSNLIIGRPTFVAWISNNGSCAGGSTYIPTYGDMLNCESGGTASQQSEAADFLGQGTYNFHGVCSSYAGATSYSTGSAVAPTSSAHQIEWDSTSSTNNAFTLTFKIGGSNVQTYSVGANVGIGAQYVFYQTGAAAGVYTITESGLSSVTCPTIGGGGSAAGVLKWYQ